MADLLPSQRDTSAAEERAPRVIGLDSDEADVLSALSSDTARRVLAALHEEPTNPAALSDRIGTSLQNAQYHLRRLEDAALVEVIDTVYSEKGREMKVYAPADRPLVVVAGGESERSTLRAALTRLLGGVAVLGLLSLLVQFALEGLPTFGLAGAGAADGASGGGSALASTEAAQAAEAAGAAAGLPPGLLFFLGGLAVLVVGFAVWYVRRS